MLLLDLRPSVNLTKIRTTRVSIGSTSSKNMNHGFVRLAEGIISHLQYRYLGWFDPQSFYRPSFELFESPIKLD